MDYRPYAYENARPEVQALVPLGARRILDLGCASGALGEALKSRHEVEVVGIERDPKYAHDAERRLDRVIVADLDEFETDSAGLGEFDCVIAADVLEHLLDPWAALSRATGALLPGGTAVVSLPNVRYWQLFLNVGLRGTWPLQDEGIFDRTHLRWFTLADARVLMGQAGLEVAAVSAQYRLRPGNWRTVRYARHFARTPLAPFFAFQYVIAGIKPGG
jgi:2-polyprenyl-3-methyl-5-hydroxy-6-metoxy-1,4-benzoquinol methylase